VNTLSRSSPFLFTSKQRNPVRSDYDRYIAYEAMLDQLRRKRKQRLGFLKGSISDYACTRRIRFVYTRALRKFTK
jgi:hypothetical protein